MLFNYFTSKKEIYFIFLGTPLYFYYIYELETRAMQGFVFKNDKKKKMRVKFT